MNSLDPSEKPVVSIMSGEAYVKSGENVTLLCVAQGGNPAPNLTWFLKGRPIDTLYDYDMNTQVLLYHTTISRQLHRNI